MKKGIFHWRSFAAIVLVVFSAWQPAQARSFFNTDYQWSDDEGPWVMKAKVGSAFLFNEEENYYQDNVAIPFGSAANEKLFSSTVSVEVEASYHVFDRLAFSAALGYQPQTTGLWSSPLSPNTDNGRINFLPVSATLQFHFAPYGQMRPYIGAGYHFTYSWSTYETLSVDNSSGLVVQAGMDWWLQKRWGMNVEIKKFWLETEMDAKALTGLNLRNEVVVDPLVVSVGVLHRF